MIRALLRLLSSSAVLPASELKVNDRDYLEARGLSVLVYQNVFHPVFRDQKLSAIEVILHDNRIATDGDVRLGPRPPSFRLALWLPGGRGELLRARSGR